jgi:ABC-type nitrate/sulfonate/bicarbonate transport system substrate-binding protein
MPIHVKADYARRALLILATALAAGLFASPQASAEAQKVRIAHSYIAAIPAVLREKGFLEHALKDRNVEVQWVTALGSNKTFEFLRGGSLDFGSSCGSAALVARANGNPVQVLSFLFARRIYSARDAPRLRCQNAGRSEREESRGNARYRAVLLAFARS